MTTQARIAFVAVRTLFGTPLPTEDFPEVNAAAWKKGAPLVLTSGFLNECGADPALIMGIATRDGQAGAADGDKRQIIHLALPGVLFRGYLDTSASEGTGTTQDADLGKSYGIAKNAATGKWYVDEADTTADRVVVWKHWDGDGQVIGDVMGHVIFSFINTVCQGIVANA